MIGIESIPFISFFFFSSFLLYKTTVEGMQLVPVVSMNSSIFKRSNCMFHKARLVQGVSVDINL